MNVFINERELVNEENQATTKLKYYRTETELAGITYFGVGIEQYKQNVDNFSLESYSEERGVTYSLETITGIIELLSNNTVMPEHLVEILDDLGDTIAREAQNKTFATA